MRIWQIISLGLLLPVVGQAGGGGQALTQAQKNALLSRKNWYLSASFSVKGSGNSGGANWTIDNSTTLTLELNHAIPGQWPPSAMSDPTALAPDLPGSFMTWMAMPTEAAMAAAERGGAKKIHPSASLHTGCFGSLRLHRRQPRRLNPNQ